MGTIQICYRLQFAKDCRPALMRVPMNDTMGYNDMVNVIIVFNVIVMSSSP